MRLKTAVFALLPRTGLANRLFVWAHSRLYAERNGVPSFTHGWGHIHIGPWLRREQSKRYYFFFFNRSSNFIGLILRKMLARIGQHQLIFEPSLLSLPPINNSTILFTSVPNKTDYFRNLRRSEAFLREELLKTLRPRYRRSVDAIARYPIAIHVRRGDFIAGGLTLSGENYFINVVQKLRQCRGDEEEIRVFSDARPKELTNLLSLPNVVMANSKPDVVELLEISKADIIVTSLGSTFGYWAAFISDADIILDPRHAYGAIRSELSVNQFEGTIDEYVKHHKSSLQRSEL